LTTELDGLDVPEVRAVQVQLNAVGYPVVVDGSYGPQTAAAVSEFQNAFGLYVDGIVGPETYAALFGLSH
jgi:peptidoglycan hydrolase-like protein with peptidoglycan-binding domain